ncbi:MAG TPA: S41 family peptidase [Verrucomicrobiae bacterium]|jgi:carboxyl-terminal processing protease|nr:S41 family peptidase [Verrucomicrobiae bacterium]
MNRAARIGVLCVSVIIFCYAGLGHVLGRTPDDKAYKSLTVYSEVLQKIQQDYVDEPNLHLVTSGALHGLLESLDPQSSYLTAREYTEYKQKQAANASGDAGLTLSKRFGYIIVVSVLPESPAEKAGIHSGDIFESVAGFTTRDMSVGQAMNFLHGQPGSGVKVGVIRRGKADPDEVDLVREKLGTAKIITAKADPDILVLRLPSLDPGRADEIRAKLQDAEKQGIHKVMLDVRDCGRGPVSEAIAIAKLFVPSGTLVTLRGQTVSTQVFSADPGKVVWKAPVSVLIDTTTSGAAEVLASAIVTNHRGDVVGERTFGLASEQKLISLDDGAALFLTVANYYNGDGKSILEEGVVPSEVVRASADEDADSGDDDSGSADAQKEPVAPRPLSPEDPIFRKALELMKAPQKKAA